MSQKIAVIGGVAAGPAAAAEAKRVDPDADVVLFEKGSDISYGACEIPYVLGGELESIDRLRIYTPESFTRAKGVSVRINTEVKEVEYGKRRLIALDSTTGENWEERFDKFILATGATVKIPAVERADALNVFPLRTLSDATSLKAFLDRNESQHAVVVGGGYVGFEIADALLSRGNRVTILQPGGRVLPDYLDDVLSTRLTDVVSAAGVTVRDERLTRIVVDPANRVQSVETSGGEKIGCKLVILATGTVPNVDLARKSNIRIGEHGGVKVNASMKTSAANVWACGDCIEVNRIIDDRPIYAPLAPTAYRTARVAAQNAAGRAHSGRSTFAGVCPTSAVKAFGYEAATVGLGLDAAIAAGFDAIAADIQHVSRVSFYPGAKPIWVRLVVDKSRGRILGGQLVGQEGAALRANVLVPLVRNRSTAEDLAELDLMYNPPVAPSLDPLFVAARAAIRKLESDRRR